MLLANHRLRIKPNAYRSRFIKNISISINKHLSSRYIKKKLKIYISGTFDFS